MLAKREKRDGTEEKHQREREETYNGEKREYDEGKNREAE